MKWQRAGMEYHFCRRCKEIQLAEVMYREINGKKVKFYQCLECDEMEREER